jgi:hypothetical protein
MMQGQQNVKLCEWTYVKFNRRHPVMLYQYSGILVRPYVVFKDGPIHHWIYVSSDSKNEAAADSAVCEHAAVTEDVQYCSVTDQTRLAFAKHISRPPKVALIINMRRSGWKYFELNFKINILPKCDWNTYVVWINKIKFCKYLNVFITHVSHFFKDKQL